MRTVVLLPGMHGIGTTFADLVAALGPEVESIVVSYPADIPLGYTELEAIVRASLPVDRPYILLAESFSGPIAVTLAAAHPAGMRGLILSSSFVKNPRPGMRMLRPLIRFADARHLPAGVLSRALLGRFWSVVFHDLLVNTLRMASPATFRARIHAIVDADASAHLVKIAMPILYLRASDDRVVPAAASELIARIMPTAKFIDIEGPHFLLQVVPDAAAGHIKDFMRGLTGDV